MKLDLLKKYPLVTFTFFVIVFAILLSFTAPASQTDDTLGAVKQVAGQSFTLAGSGISSSATSFTLTSFTIPQNGYPIQDSDISDTFYFTLEPGSRSRQEIISCTTVTQNSGGSATISGCTRGLSPVTPYTASSSLQFAHPGGSIAVLSDPPQVYNQYGALSNDETITGTWLVPTPLSDTQIASKGYVDGIVTGGVVTNDRLIVAGSAGETVATSTLVYFNGADQEWYKVDVDTTSTYEDKFIGLTQGAGTDGSAVSGGILLKGRDNLVTGLTAGNTYYAAATAGELSTTVSAQPLGIAEGTNVLYFDPVNVGVFNLRQNNTVTGTTTFSGVVEGNLKNVEYIVASSTFTGATTPQPVHLSFATNTAHLADANDTGAMAFIGFAINSVGDGEYVAVQTSGIVGGFSSLSTGAKYYLSDTAGSIATTTGTYAVLVGVAVSDTEILILRGNRYMSGAVSQADAGDTGQVSNTVLNLGFRPAHIKVTGYIVNTAGSVGFISSSWSNGIYGYARMSSDESATEGIGNTGSDYLFRMYDSGGNEQWRGTITSVGNTGATIALEQRQTSPQTIYLHWEAEGNL